MEKLTLKYLGRDIYDRPVYRNVENTDLYVDVNPHKNSDPAIFTKYDNMFDGEADKLVDKVTIEFDGNHRELWLG